ncbi:MAG TPA: cytochrome P460 family protein [Pirellulales bacterium]|nr:cytochrome P460 family protein [Pirellulales bacterium]
MRQFISTGLLLAGLVSMMFLPESVVQAQGSGSSRLSSPARQRPRTAEEFQRELWQYIARGNNASYRTWPAWPNEEGFQEGGPPHGAFVKTYANAIAAKDATTLPYGSILVNEDYDEDQKILKSVSVMYSVKGTDPKNRDWYWLNYLPNGMIARSPADQGSKPLAGKVKSCIDCHRKAGGNDLVYSNDGPEPPADNADEAAP